MSGKYTVISTFAGGGGSSLGYHMAGFNELLAIEWDKNACETLRLNFPDLLVWEKDIIKITGEEILKELNIKKGELDILDGSPPCQGFSMAAGKRNVSNKKNELFLSFCLLLKELQPKVFVMENVSGMVNGKMKGMFKIILQELKNSGYNVKCKKMNAKYYNVPQSRERLIFIGIRKNIDIEITFPVSNNKIIIFKEAVKNIKEITEPPILTPSVRNFVHLLKQGDCLYDVGGKGWQTKRIYNNKVCPCITAMEKGGGIGFGNLIHPKYDRVLAIEEIKRVCSFPDNYKLIGTWREQSCRLGNAVMPNMMKAIAENIKINILDKYYNQ